MRDKYQVTEEPCELKGSSTVLESSGSCERIADFTRSCHDAIGAIFLNIRLKPKYVLEADIAGCFDNISHQALLGKTKAPPIIQRILKGWLKCGVMDGVFQPTEAGTPQGGVISPLLANIALHGLEEQVHQIGTKTRPTIQLVRYADDFVAFANNESDMNGTKKSGKACGLSS